MKLYHGSYVAVEQPDITFSRDNVDFGRGFYVTPIKEQAVSWAKRFKRSRGQGIVSVYEVDEQVLMLDNAVLLFNEYSIEWLDFIIACRQGDGKGGYDVVAGGVANDQVFNTIQLFLDGLIDKEESLKRLKYEKPNMQFCFCNQKVIDTYLEFVGSEVV